MFALLLAMEQPLHIASFHCVRWFHVGLWRKKDISGPLHYWILYVVMLTWLKKRYVHWCNSGTNDGELNGSILIGVEACSMGGNFWLCTVNLTKSLWLGRPAALESNLPCCFAKWSCCQNNIKIFVYNTDLCCSQPLSEKLLFAMGSN